jgi:hypothetical protein
LTNGIGGRRVVSKLDGQNSEGKQFIDQQSENYSDLKRSRFDDDKRDTD